MPAVVEVVRTNTADEAEATQLLEVLASRLDVPWEATPSGREFYFNAENVDVAAASDSIAAQLGKISPSWQDHFVLSV